MLSAQRKHLDPRAVYAVIHIRVGDIFSHSDAANICVFWEENPDSRHSFDHIFRPFWRDCLGDQQRVNPSVPKAIFIEAYL